MRYLAICLCSLALASSTSSAQQAVKSATAGPTLQSAAVGFKINEASANASTAVTAAPLVRRHAGQDVALMAVGVGAMIVGAVVGGTAGTIVIIGGAAMALFGLYHYLE